MRLCPFCNLEFPLESFPRSNGRLRGKCRDCVRAYDRALRARQKSENAEAYKAKVFAQSEKRRDKARLYSKAYREKHPEKALENSRRRRAKRLGNKFEKYSEAQVLEIYGSVCYLCKVGIDLSAPRRAGRPGWELGLHIDHVLPLWQSGPDTLENVRPSHAKCNLSRTRTL